jgi:hypothetical protein
MALLGADEVVKFADEFRTPDHNEKSTIFLSRALYS